MKWQYHLIGIGGIGMSALARILLRRGQRVSGSDLKESPLIEGLRKEGAKIFIGHAEENIGRADVVVFSSEVRRENPEYRLAEERKLPILHRSALLTELMRGHAPILVTGTHGKTTTSSLCTHVLIESHLRPSYAIGGCLKGTGINGDAGDGLYFIAEADESDGTFLCYPSFGAIVTNLDLDHMDFWKTKEALIRAFRQFGEQVGSKKHFFWCYDDLELRALKMEGYSYGFNRDADLVIENFRQVGWVTIFDLTFEGKRYPSLEIPLIGAHNVLNASAVFGLCLKLDLAENQIRSALQTFKGVGRRVEKKGMCSGVVIYDDYAHHPTEIYATLRALKSAQQGHRIVVAFQPHRYSRTKHCLDDFAEAFEPADQVVLTDIYGAGEMPISGVTPQKIIERIGSAKSNKVRFVEREGLTPFLATFLQPNDTLVTMGAGDITKVGPEVLAVLEKEMGEERR